MKYVLEFGVRGGAHVDNVVLPTAKLAAELAARLVMVFSNNPSSQEAIPRCWYAPTNKMTRQTWTSPTHFVSISQLDGVARGSASAALWKLPAGEAK